MKRTDLTDTLARVAPGLSSKDLIPVLSCFCFDGKTVTAYDDVVALRAPLEFPVVGAVKGKLLLDFLSGSRASDVDVRGKGPEVSIKAGRSKLDTTALPEEDFVFRFPADEGEAGFPLSGAIVSGVRMAMLSMGLDPSYPARQGVTLSVSEGKATLYSTDNKRATRVRVKAPKGLKDMVVVLPPRFCSLLVELSGRDKAGDMVLRDGSVVAKFESGLELFSKTIPDSNVDDYVKLFKRVKGSEGLREVPKGLDRALDQALVVIPYAKDPHTAVEVADGKLTLRTTSTAGNVRNSIPLDGHPDLSVLCDPNLFRQALNHSSRFRIIDAGDKGFPGCLHFEGEGMVHLVTLIRADDKE